MPAKMLYRHPAAVQTAGELPAARYLQQALSYRGATDFDGTCPMYETSFNIPLTYGLYVYSSTISTVKTYKYRAASSPAAVCTTAAGHGYSM
eukprot:5649521-Pleurochrysis_carterae.AAC.1